MRDGTAVSFSQAAPARVALWSFNVNLCQMVLSIGDLSPILALRSLSTFEGCFETDSEVRVSGDAGREDWRGLFLQGSDEPVIEAFTVSDTVRWSVRAPSLLTLDVKRALGAIGLDKVSGSMDLEEFDDRAAAIDKIWCLGRRAKALDSQRAASLVEDLMQLATAWHSNRMSRFDANGQKPDLEAARERLEASARCLVGTYAGAVEAIEMFGDPRGASLEVKFAGTPDGVYVCGLGKGWRASTFFLKASSVAPTHGAGRFAVKPSKLDADVVDVLCGAQLVGRELRLLATLDPRLYKRVNAVLMELGGRWSTSKSAHLFARPAAEVLATVLEHGVAFTRRDFEFFETQPEEVRRMLQLAGLLRGMRVLEPSAGQGAIAMAASALVGPENVRCFELMPENVEALRSKGLFVDGPTDFLGTVARPEFDVVLANPPFSGDRDIAHVTHALGFLKPGGRLVAITSVAWNQRRNAAQRAFAQLVDEWGGEVHEVRRGAFAAVGTNVPTLMVVLVRKRHGALDRGSDPAVARKSAGRTTEVDQLALDFF